MAALARRRGARRAAAWLYGGARRRSGRVAARGDRSDDGRIEARPRRARGMASSSATSRSTASRTLLAAIREAVVDAARHAAVRATVGVFVEGDRGELTGYVRDIGGGFDPGDGARPTGEGISDSIVGRVQRRGGRALLHSQPGAGTPRSGDHRCRRPIDRADRAGRGPRPVPCRCPCRAGGTARGDPPRRDRRRGRFGGGGVRVIRPCARTWCCSTCTCRAAAARVGDRRRSATHAGAAAVPGAVGVGRGGRRDRRHPRRGPWLRDEDDQRPPNCSTRSSACTDGDAVFSPRSPASCSTRSPASPLAGAERPRAGPAHRPRAGGAAARSPAATPTRRWRPRLYLSVKTVETHVSAVLRKLQLSNRHQLTAWANARRLV